MGIEKNEKENSRVEMKIFYSEVCVAINGEGKKSWPQNAHLYLLGC